MCDRASERARAERRERAIGVCRAGASKLTSEQANDPINLRVDLMPFLLAQKMAFVSSNH